MLRSRWLVLLLSFVTTQVVSDVENKRKKQVQDDLKRFANDDYWIYNDFERGITKAPCLRIVVARSRDLHSRDRAL